MAEQSGFFDAHLVDGAYDRVYLANSFAQYFASFIGNGVFGGKSNELMVQQKSTADMSVRVLSGQGWINGYWYKNDSELSLAVDIADGVLNRIDLVVLRWDNFQRKIHLLIKKGTPALTAVAPTVQRDADYYELKLAEISVKAGTTNITQSSITDTRLDVEACGIVTSVVKNFDTTDFYRQMETFIEELKAETTAEIDAMIEELESLIDGNDVVNLKKDVETLKTFATESSEYKGCYYRTVNGETEWLNPPDLYGIEYRTTERWNGKPVYKKTLYVAALPNSSYVSISTSIWWDKVVSISGYAIDSDNMNFYPFPVTMWNSVTPSAIISNMEYDGNLVLFTSEDMTSYQAYITIKYVKS